MGGMARGWPAALATAWRGLGAWRWRIAGMRSHDAAYYYCCVTKGASAYSWAHSRQGFWVYLERSSTSRTAATRFLRSASAARQERRHCIALCSVLQSHQPRKKSRSPMPACASALPPCTPSAMRTAPVADGVAGAGAGRVLGVVRLDHGAHRVGERAKRVGGVGLAIRAHGVGVCGGLGALAAGDEDAAPPCRPRARRGRRGRGRGRGRP